MWCRVVFFLVLAAGAALHAARTAGETGILDGEGAITGPGRFRLGDGRVITGYAYLNGVAEFLKEATPKGLNIYLLGEEAEPAFWLSYLAYPRLVRYVPFAHAKIRLSLLPPGRFLVVVIPPTLMKIGAGTTWNRDRLQGTLRGLLEPVTIEILHESPLGSAVFEVER